MWGEAIQAKKCTCKWCTTTHPNFKKLCKALEHDPEALAIAEGLFNDLMHAEENSDYYFSQLNGTWPGWEWIIEERKKRLLWNDVGEEIDSLELNPPSSCQFN
jgi:hypothetical protein